MSESSSRAARASACGWRHAADKSTDENSEKIKGTTFNNQTFESGSAWLRQSAGLVRKKTAPTNLAKGRLTDLRMGHMARAVVKKQKIHTGRLCLWLWATWCWTCPTVWRSLKQEFNADIRFNEQTTMADKGSKKWKMTEKLRKTTIKAKFVTDETFNRVSKKSPLMRCILEFSESIIFYFIAA